jgi:hypothetical protein
MSKFQKKGVIKSSDGKILIDVGLLQKYVEE